MKPNRFAENRKKTMPHRLRSPGMGFMLGIFKHSYGYNNTHAD
jgi:hypothetical protein